MSFLPQPIDIIALHRKQLYCFWKKGNLFFWVDIIIYLSPKLFAVYGNLQLWKLPMDVYHISQISYDKLVMW